jgi:hypothetical protein
MRITESQLRKVVRKIIAEQVETSSMPVSDELYDEAEYFQTVFDVHHDEMETARSAQALKQMVGDTPQGRQLLRNAFTEVTGNSKMADQFLSAVIGMWRPDSGRSEVYLP